MNVSNEVSNKKNREIFKTPVVLNTWGEQQLDHRSENWMELFIDLFYVAIFLKLGDYIYTCGLNVLTIDYVASIFFGVYMAKFDFDQYMNKFSSDDILHKIFFLFYSLGLAIMTLNVNSTAKV
jgi:hypothetical protein